MSDLKFGLLQTISMDEIEILISEDFKDKFDIQKSAFLVSMDRNNYQVFYLPLKPSERKYIDSKLNM